MYKTISNILKIFSVSIRHRNNFYRMSIYLGTYNKVLKCI